MRPQPFWPTTFATVRSVYQPHPAAMPTRDTRQSDARTIVAVVGNCIAGAALVYTEGNALHISRLAVLPSMRRTGIARAILLFADKAATDQGLPNLRLNTIQETGNVEIFQQLGFSVIKSSVATWCSSDRFDALTDVEMEKACVAPVESDLT